MRAAALIGISPLEFWELTPYELSIILEVYGKKKTEDAKEKITIAYMTALWAIQWLGKKKPKPLKDILSGIGKEKKTMTDKQMLEQIKALNAMFGGEVKAGGKV